MFILILILFSQLIYDGHSTIAATLAAQVKAVPPCCPSSRLLNLVTIGLQHETDGQKESEEASNLNPIKEMLIGQGIGMFNDLNIIYIFVLNLLIV